MKVSIIVPVYNTRRPLLESCLDSVARQTLRRHEYEIILVDDCSTDKDTLAVIDAFVQATPNMKLVRHAENRNPNEARRSGVRAATGDYVLFVDSDDVVTRDATENLRMRALQTGADLVTAPAFRWAGGTFSYSPWPATTRPMPSDYMARLKAVLAGRHSFTMCGRLFRREILSDDVFDAARGQWYHEDITTFARAAFEVRSAAYTLRPVYFYTVNEGGLTFVYTRSHTEGQFHAVGDWIETARRHGLYDELSGAISRGVRAVVDNAVTRCLLCESLDDDEKAEVLQMIRERWLALALPRLTSPTPSTELLERLPAYRSDVPPSRLQEAVSNSFPGGIPARPDGTTRLERSLVPTEMARRLKHRVVFICRNDYHLRNAASFARELKLRGHRCVILDDSPFASAGRRRLPEREKSIFDAAERIQVARPPYDPDWLSTAGIVITFNDFNDDFREALEYRHRLGLPSVCMVEGINDFLRVDFDDIRLLPYRRCDYVFLAGHDDEKYFEDRQTHVVGLPIIESLATKAPVFRDRPLAVLNVNFTYGALEEAREQFVAMAGKAFEAAGYRWLITKHPMDMASLRGYPVSKLTQYELIDRCSVFVSRFATGILEALASGKPAVYFNPHGEKVEKFKQPMGAYEVANTQEELVQALRNVQRDIEAGVDFRERALPFLERHTGYRSGGTDVAHRLADAVAETLTHHEAQQAAVADLFLERLREQVPFRQESPDTVLGDFDHRHRAELQAGELVARYFGRRPGLMLDIGATTGSNIGLFLDKGWTVHAFEPDRSSRQRLRDAWPSCPQLTIHEAVSSGSEARATTPADYCRKAGLDHVDFLRIGFGGPAGWLLNGLPREEGRPDVVLIEVADARKAPSGYSAHEVAGTLLSLGYSVYASQWLPAGRPGLAAHWRRLVLYSPALDVDTSRVDVLGFLEDPGADALGSLARRTLRFSGRPGSEKVYPAAPRGLLAAGYQRYLRTRYRLIEYLMWKYPRLVKMYRKLRERGLLPQIRS